MEFLAYAPKTEFEEAAAAAGEEITE